jgi:SAM-dependent methyltransferase
VTGSWRGRATTGIRLPILLARSVLATRAARRLDGPGLEWGAYGRRLGRRLAWRGDRAALDLLLVPVSIVRHWEYPFAWSCLPPNPARCLDVGSPRLFSLRVAEKFPRARVTMINPDRHDASLSRRIARRLSIAGVAVSTLSIEDMRGEAAGYDCAWSLSVIEHIDGPDGDSDGIREMYRALVPGGRLIVTVPVDRKFRLEYRDRDAYGLHADAGAIAQRFFFQRYYDEAAIERRLFAAVGQAPSVVRWFGELQAGRFLAYERSWQRDGYRRTVDDPIEIARHYTEFETWAEMPGVGVCGFAIDKPLEAHDS